MTDTSSVFAVADLTADGAELSRNLTYLVPVKEVHLEPAVIGVEAADAGGSFTIRATSPVLARSVYLSFGDLDVNLSDNYFDLLPGETVEIHATTSVPLAELRSKLKVISLSDAFDANGPAGTEPIR